jgi:hypothetical protein
MFCLSTDHPEKNLTGQAEISASGRWRRIGGEDCEEKPFRNHARNRILQKVIIYLI